MELHQTQKLLHCKGDNKETRKHTCKLIIKGLMSRRYQALTKPKQQQQQKNSSFKIWTKNLNRQVSREEIQLSNKYIKKCLVSPASREMQNKLTVRYHLTAIMKSTESNKC